MHFEKLDVVHLCVLWGNILIIYSLSLETQIIHYAPDKKKDK